MSLARVLSTLVAHATYPGIIVVSVALAERLLHHGVSTSLSTSTAFVVPLVLCAVLERTHPHERSWNPPWSEIRQDFLYLLLASAAQSVARVMGQLVAALLAVALLEWLGPRPWPPGWPLWAQLVLALALADLGKYWVHRLAHEHPWLWRFHAEHHAPSRMVSLNGVRIHPVNLLWNFALDAGIPLVLGLDARAVALVAVFRGAVSVLQHANVELRVGPLHWILSTPDLHQWHHSAALEEARSNYGSTFIVWDVLFKTRALPRERSAPVSLGLADGSVRPSRLWHQLVWPWCASRAATCRQLRGWSPRVVGRAVATDPR